MNFTRRLIIMRAMKITEKHIQKLEEQKQILKGYCTQLLEDRRRYQEILNRLQQAAQLSGTEVEQQVQALLAVEKRIDTLSNQLEQYLLQADLAGRFCYEAAAHPICRAWVANFLETENERYLRGFSQLTYRQTVEMYDFLYFCWGYQHAGKSTFAEFCQDCVRSDLPLLRAAGLAAAVCDKAAAMFEGTSLGLADAVRTYTLANLLSRSSFRMTYHDGQREESCRTSGKDEPQDRENVQRFLKAAAEKGTLECENLSTGEKFIWKIRTLS